MVAGAGELPTGGERVQRWDRSSEMPETLPRDQPLSLIPPPLSPSLPGTTPSLHPELLNNCPMLGLCWLLRTQGQSPCCPQGGQYGNWQGQTITCGLGSALMERGSEARLPGSPSASTPSELCKLHKVLKSHICKVGP